jgi:group I intron endonuclease
MKKTNVYLITCSANGKKYVGITVLSAETRFKHHVRKATGPSAQAGAKLQAAIRKYGPEAFHIETLEVCETWKEACEREVTLIAEHDTYRNGYNSTVGGDGTIGYEPSKEQKARRAASLKGIPRTPEWKARIGAANKGKKPVDTPEKRAAVSRAHKGKKRPPEWKAKIAATIQAQWDARRAADPEKYPPKPERKLPVRTEEHKAKLREASLRQWQKKRDDTLIEGA